MWYSILPAVYISRSSLWSKAVAFTCHWELKHWHQSGLVPTFKSWTPNFDFAYWTWQSKLNPVQPASFFNFLLSLFFSWLTWDCIHISQLLAEGVTKCGAVVCYSRTSSLHVQFHVCLDMVHSTPELSGVLWIGSELPLPSVESVGRCSTDFWLQCCSVKERIAKFWIYFVPYCSL